jgi:hypothetical protein
VKSLGSLQRFRLSSTFVLRRIEPTLIQIQIALSINRDIHPGQARVSSYQLARKTSAFYAGAFRQFLIAVSRE